MFGGRTSFATGFIGSDLLLCRMSDLYPLQSRDAMQAAFGDVLQGAKILLGGIGNELSTLTMNCADWISPKWKAAGLGYIQCPL